MLTLALVFVADEHGEAVLESADNDHCQPQSVSWES